MATAVENDTQIVPPHLNAEVYRTDTTGTDTVSYLDHIHMHPDGSILIGSSELTGRYWNGSASVYKNISEAQHCSNKSKKTITLISGTSDGCFIDNSAKILLCEDNGTVSVWSENTNDAWNVWQEDISVAEHDDAALAVDCLLPGKQYVTVGADGKIKVWDVNEMICVRNYDMAHGMSIYGVAVQPQSTKNFATASDDQYVCLWDENTSKPVKDLLKNNCGVRCLQWIDENHLVYGDDAGLLRMIDIRHTDGAQLIAEFPAAIHRISINSSSNKVAVCCDNKIVSVCDIHENGGSKVVYHDRHMHTNYVRGLAWGVNEKTQLYSVGWDGEIKTHKIA